MPDKLDETLVTRKRKDAPAAPEAPARKKRSRIAAREAKEAKAKLVVKTRVAGKVVTPGKSAAANGKPAKKSKAAPAPPSDDEDDILDSDDLDANVTGLDALGSADEDDAFDSDDVMDSGDEITRGAAMWSDDDDEDLEERLTAANIEGLSKKLDMQKAIEDAEAAAELEEGMQTNIVGDERPKILEDEEDEEGRPITNLVGAQDIGLLRTRLNDTVRVLDSFKTLGEEGRSRADYTASLLADFCAYYGMSSTLVYCVLQPEKIRRRSFFLSCRVSPNSARTLTIKKNDRLRTVRQGKPH
jgi:ribosomal RNA methyltransferase Nop2